MQRGLPALGQRTREASGTKAAENAPSANRLRNRFGRRWAIKNASATGPAPRIAAVSMSRTKPKTRLTIVSEPTVATERNKAMRWRCNGKSAGGNIAYGEASVAMPEIKTEEPSRDCSVAAFPERAGAPYRDAAA